MNKVLSANYVEEQSKQAVRLVIPLKVSHSVPVILKC